MAPYVAKLKWDVHSYCPCVMNTTYIAHLDVVNRRVCTQVHTLRFFFKKTTMYITPMKNFALTVYVRH